MPDISKQVLSNTTLRKHFQKKIIGSLVKFVLLSLNITEADCCHILEASDDYMAEGSDIKYVTRQIVVTKRVIVSSNIIVRKKSYSQ